MTCTVTKVAGVPEAGWMLTLPGATRSGDADGLTMRV